MDVSTVCPYCGVGCGILLRVEEGRPVASLPVPGHPVSQGTLCPKGATAHEPVLHPDRLKTPLVRRNGELVRASWDEAYDEVVRGFRRVLDEHGPEAIGLVSSARATVEENYLAQKMARAVLGTNNLDNCYRVCHSPTVFGLGDVLGSGAMTNPLSDLALARAILIVGNNTPHSHPIAWTVWIKKARDAGAQLVVVDPRRTEAAKAADLHLPIRPGGEIPLFNAMAAHILANGWQDDAFLAERTEGIEPLRQHLASWSIERGARAAGVPARDVERAAEIYATTRPASIVYGLGVTEHRNGTDNVRALANLALLTGNLGKPGTGVNALRGQNNVQGATDICRPETLPGYQPWTGEALPRFEAAYGMKLPAPAPDADWLWCSRMWESALAGELRAMWLIGTDPALTEGNLAKVRRALGELDFLVVQDLYPTPTSQLAHVVLPACSFAEKDGTFVNTERRVQRIRKAIEPVGESKPDWLILVEIAERLGRPLGVSSPEEAFDEMRGLVPSYAGISYARIEDEGVPWPCTSEDAPPVARLHERAFPRGLGKLSCVDAMTPSEEPDEEYPFLLTTGRTFFQYNCGSMSRRSRMEKGQPRAFVEMCEEDARRLGVRHGEMVRVTSRRGSVEVEAHVVDIAPGVLWMPFHYAEAAANLLTSDVVDPESGVTELKACAVSCEGAKVAKGAKEGAQQRRSR